MPNTVEVILNQDVDHLGFSGDVVDVKKGYWRNYLRPRGLARAAHAGLLADMRQRMELRRRADARNESEAAELKSLLDRTLLTIPVHAGPTGKLYGSVTSADIAKQIESARKLRVNPKKIVLDEPIRSLGTFMVPVDLYEGVRSEIKTMVVQRTDEPAPEEDPSDEADSSEAGDTADAASPDADAAETPAAEATDETAASEA